MHIQLDSSLTTRIPDFKIGIIHYTKITVGESPQMIQGRTRLYQESLYFDLQDGAVTERAGINEWRDVWRQLGSNPSRYRHSTEAMLRRIAKADYLQPVNSAVDLNNFFSLQYEIPVGSYDTAHVDGTITLALGTKETSYEALNGRVITLDGIAYAKDATGAFGSPYVDSTRTAVTEHARDVLQIFYLRPSMTRAEADKLLAAAGHMFTQINGGEYEKTVLDADYASTTM